MKRSIQKISLVFGFMLCLGACGNATLSQVETTTTCFTTTVEEASVSSQPESEALPTLSIIQNGETVYSVILPFASLTKPGGTGISREGGKVTPLPTTVDTPTSIATQTLINTISEKTGVTVPMTHDGVLHATSAGECEILIGLTDREESRALHQTLSERSFAIQSVGQKIVIVGYDDNMTTAAVHHFIEKYILEAEQYVSSGSYKVPAELSYVSEQKMPILENTIHIGGQYVLKDAELFTRIAKDGNYQGMQGGCTDGNYMYYCLQNAKLNPNESHIYKVSVETGKVVKRSEALQLDHSNDMTYNSKTGQLLVVHNAPNRKLVSIIDPETLEKKETFDIGRNIFSIAYNELRDQYVVGLSGGQTFAILDAAFHVLREYSPVAATKNTTQGMTCDDNFIYFAQSGDNVVVVYDWDGYQVGIIPIEFTDLETENIAVVDGTFYIAFYRGGSGGGVIYRADLTVKS